jgi:hypothetical protein
MEKFHKLTNTRNNFLAQTRNIQTRVQADIEKLIQVHVQTDDSDVTIPAHCGKTRFRRKLDTSIVGRSSGGGALTLKLHGFGLNNHGE